MTMLISTNNDLIHETFIHARTLKQFRREGQRKANLTNSDCLIRGFINNKYVELTFVPHN